MADPAVKAEENLGLVHACAGRFRGRGIDYDDLFQAGCVGLVKAAGNFDGSLGYRFSTYAVPVIIGEIKRLFRDGGAVKISRGLKELSLKVTKATREFVVKNGREPTVSELSELLGTDTETIIEALEASKQPVSLTVSDEDGETQTDIPVAPPDEKITEKLSLESELQRLNDEDRRLIEYRFYKGFTQTRTAELLGTTQVQICRREKKLLLLLRSRLS